MKLILLSNPNSVHTIKWAKSLSKNGIDIVIFGFGNLTVNDYDNISNIEVKSLDESITRNEGAFNKIKYLKAVPIIKKLIKNFNPDIVHAHYASSYGLIGALCGFHPFIVSVWGSDVFSFPKKSFLHKFILKYTLNKADKLLSTSHVMVKETKKYTKKEIVVTPFGINIDKFKPAHVFPKIFHLFGEKY